MDHKIFVRALSSLRLSIVLFVVSFLMYSCSTGSKAVSQYKPLEPSLLWKIEGNGISKPSYLYGTIHIIGSEDFFWPQGTMTAFDQSKKIMYEIDIKEMTDISALMGIMGKVFMKDGKTLKDLLNDEEYKLVSDHFQKMGLPIFMLERIKPMFLTVFAYGDMNPTDINSGKLKSYEMELNELAGNAQKETGGLETVDFQVGLFDEIPYEAQAKMLVEGLKSTKGENDEFRKMTDMYKRQDIHKMATMAVEQGSDISGFEDKLLNQRNHNWIPKIIFEAKAQQTFFAVGAGHLGGPEGVIHLLRKEGLKVTPVK